MKPNEIIENIMKEKGISKAQLGRACGIKSSDEENKSYQSDVISKRLKQQKLSVTLFVEMLDAMGYTVLVDQKGKKGEYEVSTE